MPLRLHPKEADRPPLFFVSQICKDHMAPLEIKPHAKLDKQLRFERLLAEISTFFINLPTDRIDSEIEAAQRRVCEFLDLDRSSLFQVPEGDPGTLLLTHTYQPAGTRIPPERMSLREFFPWALQKVLGGETITISKMTDLPAEAGRDRETFGLYGTRSVVVAPLAVGTRGVFGLLTFAVLREEREWTQTVVQQFKLVAQIFANALARGQAERSLRESERKLRQNESDLRGLAGRLIYAQEEERSRLARELHDDLAQRLAVVAIDVGRLELQLLDLPAPVREALREMKNGLVRISQDVHNLSRQLHPSILDDLGLIKAVESECAGFAKREGIEVVFNHANIPRVIPKDVALSLYRIIQEGLRNISKHACAQHSAVSLQRIDHDVLLSVQDDGIGFDWAEATENPGLGFSSMRERARLIRGEFSIKSEPEKGTKIFVRAPLQRNP
jgi:signal transduction histidine kinase